MTLHGGLRYVTISWFAAPGVDPELGALETGVWALKTVMDGHVWLNSQALGSQTVR